MTVAQPFESEIFKTRAQRPLAASLRTSKSLNMQLALNGNLGYDHNRGLLR